MKFAAYDDISIYGLDYACTPIFLPALVFALPRITHEAWYPGYLHFYTLWYLRSRRGILIISPYAQLPAMQPKHR